MPQLWSKTILVLLAFAFSAHAADLRLGGFAYASDDGQMAPLRFHETALIKSLDILAAEKPALIMTSNRLDLHRVEVQGGKASARLETKEWSYVRYQMLTETNRNITRWVRHLLMVEPDVLVVYDEIQALPGTSGDWQFTAAMPMKYDAAQKTLDLTGDKCGATVRFMLRGDKPKEMTVPTVDEAKGVATVHWTAAEPEVRLLLVLVAHNAGKKRSLAFKRLDSLNATGLRVHRDGYPALIAIRNFGLEEPVRLGGMDFQTPAAVYVDRPKAKK